jgi:pimeloyl-ACP methyl ester carboxylesterase
VETDDSGGPPRHDVPRGGRSGFVVVGEGRQVHYLEWGRPSAPPVVCLHGGGQTAYMFEDLGAALRDRYWVLAPDLPGHGDSDVVDGVAIAHAGFAASLPVVLDEFGIDRAAFVGASLGGMTAIALADLRPELVSCISLIDVGHRLEPEGVRKIVDFMTEHDSFASLEEAAEAIGEYLPQRRAPRIESLTRNLRQRPDGRWEWKHAVGRRMRERRAETGDAAHPADRLDEILAGVQDAAARLRCPVLVLRGERSDVLSSSGAEEVAALIPDARLEVVERAGHLAAGDNPHSTTGRIEAFLSEVWPGAVPA